MYNSNENFFNQSDDGVQQSGSKKESNEDSNTSKSSKAKIIFKTIIFIFLAYFINSFLSETIATGLFFDSFMDHGITIYDLMMPVTVLMSIITFLLIVQSARMFYFQNKNWKKYRNIIYSFWLSLVVIRIAGVMFHSMSWNFIGFTLSFIIFFYVCYALLSRLGKDSEEQGVLVSNANNKLFYYLVSTILLFMLYSVGFVIYLFVVIYGFCGGEGTGCGFPEFLIFLTGGAFGLFILFIWWKIVSKLKSVLWPIGK